MTMLRPQYSHSGLSTIPIRADGSKAPACRQWKQYQSRIPTDGELQELFGGRKLGTAIICGKVSGGLEVLDFDTPGLFEPFVELVEESHAGLIARLPKIQTPRGGMHVYYRCSTIEGNQKLAEESGTQDATGRPTVLTLIETRGEGGYVLAPGCPPECHETGRTYEHIAGPPLTQIPTIEPTERDVLLTAARSFNRWVDPQDANSGSVQANGRPNDGQSVGDDFGKPRMLLVERGRFFGGLRVAVLQHPFRGQRGSPAQRRPSLKNLGGLQGEPG